MDRSGKMMAMTSQVSASVRPPPRSPSQLMAHVGGGSGGGSGGGDGGGDGGDGDGSDGGGGDGGGVTVHYVAGGRGLGFPRTGGPDVSCAGPSKSYNGRGGGAPQWLACAVKVRRRVGPSSVPRRGGPH
ncbi:unnamed protein product [Lampetra planeri]